MSRDIDDLRHPERCPTCGQGGWMGEAVLVDGLWEYCPDPFHDTPTPSLPPEVERMFHAAWCNEDEAEGERLMRGLITSQAEEIERLRILVSDIHREAAGLVLYEEMRADRDEWKARAEELDAALLALWKVAESCPLCCNDDAVDAAYASLSAAKEDK